MAPVEHSEEKDALWNLLGRASRTEASPFFAGKVIRLLEKPAPRPFLVTLLRTWLPLPAFAAVAVTMLFSVTGYQQQHDNDVAAFNRQFDAIMNIDSITSGDDASTLLTDNQ